MVLKAADGLTYLDLSLLCHESWAKDIAHVRNELAFLISTFSAYNWMKSFSFQYANAPIYGEQGYNTFRNPELIDIRAIPLNYMKEENLDCKTH